MRLTISSRAADTECASVEQLPQRLPNRAKWVSILGGVVVAARPSHTLRFVVFLLVGISVANMVSAAECAASSQGHRIRIGRWEQPETRSLPAAGRESAAGGLDTRRRLEVGKQGEVLCDVADRARVRCRQHFVPADRQGHLSCTDSRLQSSRSLACGPTRRVRLQHGPNRCRGSQCGWTSCGAAGDDRRREGTGRDRRRQPRTLITCRCHRRLLRRDGFHPANQDTAAQDDRGRFDCPPAARRPCRPESGTRPASIVGLSRHQR